MTMNAVPCSALQAHFHGIPSKSFPKSPEGPLGEADQPGVGTGTVSGPKHKNGSIDGKLSNESSSKQGLTLHCSLTGGARGSGPTCFQ